MRNNNQKDEAAIIQEMNRISAEGSRDPFFSDGFTEEPERPRHPGPTRPSAAQFSANRQNARHSTGPRTQQGKNRSRLNTTTHGFTSQGVLLSALEIPVYKAHLTAFLNEHKPKGPTERFLVETISEIAWTVSKIRAQEQNFLSIVGQTGHNNFEGSDPEMNVLLAQATHSHTNAKYVELFSRYEQRKMRTFRESLRDLKQLQKDRKLTEQPPAPPPVVKEAVQEPVKKAVKTATAASQPENGFVCPEPKIMTAQAIEIYPHTPPSTL